MEALQQIAFIFVACVAVYFFVRNVKNIRRNILLGRDVEIGNNKKERWRNVLLLALGQRKMFKYPLVAVM
ncbi:MAG TPA: Fe-S oxidoreductase, partial [Segetibacter sp.]